MQRIPLDLYRWQIPKTGPMQVPGIIYSSEAGISKMVARLRPMAVVKG